MKGKCLKLLKQAVKIKIANTQLEVVSDYKYLGIQLDRNLDYNTHIKYIKSKNAQRHLSTNKDSLHHWI